MKPKARCKDACRPEVQLKYNLSKFYYTMINKKVSATQHGDVRQSVSIYLWSLKEMS